MFRKYKPQILPPKDVPHLNGNKAQPNQNPLNKMGTESPTLYLPLLHQNPRTRQRNLHRKKKKLKIQNPKKKKRTFELSLKF